MEFYRCEHCGNIITYIKDSGVKVVCCGEPMKLIVPNSTDAAGEKHVPVIEVNGKEVVVKIGSVAHPMAAEHHIEWVVLETKEGRQRKALTVDGAPEVKFTITDTDEVVNAYAYCNLHGLWSAK